MRALFVAATLAFIAPVAHAAVEDDLRDGDKFLEAGDLKKAAAAYDRAIESAPGQVPAEAYGQRARIYILLKDYKGGLSFIQTAKTRYPNAPEILEQEALILWGTDRKQDAVQIAEKVVKARPQAYSNQLLIGDFYAERDSVKTAAAFEGYLQYRPASLEKEDVKPRFRLGQAYLQNGVSVLGDGDEARAKQLYEKAAQQFEILLRKHGKQGGNATPLAENGLCAVYSGLNRWDQAISLCERVLDSRKIEARGAVYYNLANAYLARKQTKKARSAANEFARMRKNEARGFMLIGDTYFEERDWQAALDQYLRAEKALRPGQRREQVLLSIKLGKTYRRIPAPPGANNPYLANAIAKLENAQQQNPGSIELAVELGGAYVEARQDGKATAITDRMLSGGDVAKATPEQRAALLVVSGKALFNQKKLKEARARFDEARQLRPADIQVSRALVMTINEQAYEEGKDYNAAKTLLEEALRIDKDNPTTLTNLAVLSLERGDCDTARAQLINLENKRGRDVVITQRLLGRSYMCQTRPDAKRASEAFAKAEAEAKKAGAQLWLAEIYTEWAPMTWNADLQGAVEKLELAVQVSGQNAQIAPAAQRNLALALYMRGWQNMKQGKATEAASDFDRATRNPNVLKGSEHDAFQFSLALAQLDTGRQGEAAKTFRMLAAKGTQDKYLKGAYAQIGAQFFTAYANYRSTQGAQREKACQELSSMEGSLGGPARELVASCWESVAYDHWRAGAVGAAQKAIANAEKSATADQKRRLINNKAVATQLGKNNQQELEALGGNPAESLVNLGIVYDMMNKPREAYDAWTRAKAKGVASPAVQKWIDAKKRIYGY